MKIIVCVKQVPDTSGVVAVKADGTMDRAAMATISNPDDMNALEAALQIKETNPDVKVCVVSMGPPPTESMLRECLAMGADEAYLVSAREFGGADTWATSNTLAAAIEKIGVDKGDVVMCGRQAIDGDTAQVGPQIAEKLGLPQVTYAEDILEVADGHIIVKRRLEHGVETVKAPLPCVVTVNGSAAECRPRNAQRVMKYKRAVSPSEKAQLPAEAQAIVDAREYLQLKEWGAAFVEADPNQIGMAGSPTKVKAIENVVFTAKESRRIDNDDAQLEQLIVELIANHTIG